MMTLRLFSKGLPAIPTATTWYLTDLAESLGKQGLYTRQSPRKLKVLRKHALIESAVSSNRLEGVEIDQGRIGTVIFGQPLLRDRSEEEISGYRTALQEIHERRHDMTVSETTILHLHRLVRGQIWDAGQYKTQDADIIERYPDGRERVRFRMVPATRTAESIAELVRLWDECLRERPVHPLVAMAAFNLDFLCIHPFRDGNGRVSRLLLLLQSYHLGCEVGCYISLERLIEQNKERYYETLEQSSQGWHEGRHDPWPLINYLLFILKTAYREFEERVGQVRSPRGSKTELVQAAIAAQAGPFHLADLQRQCPGVSTDMIRRVLKDLRRAGQLTCLGRGPNAEWHKTDTWQLGNTHING